MDETSYLREEVRYALTHHLLRHPVIWGAAVLFLVSLVFLAFGTIKVQSLAIDINQQGRDALDRALKNIEQVSNSAVSSIELAEKASLNRVQGTEIEAKTQLNGTIGSVLNQGIESVRDEAANAVRKIKSEGETAIDARVRDLHEKINELQEQIVNLERTQAQLSNEAPSIIELISDWESIKTKGESWQASLKLAAQRWRVLVIELFACIIFACILSFFVARRASRK